MAPFKPTPQQLEALQNGATKLWIPSTVTSIKTKCDEDLKYVHTLIIESSPLQVGEQYFCITDTHCIFTVTDVEVKQVQDLDIEDAFALGISCPAETEVMSWHDNQYPEQPYSTNPLGFLISIERI